MSRLKSTQLTSEPGEAWSKPPDGRAEEAASATLRVSASSAKPAAVSFSVAASSSGVRGVSLTTATCSAAIREARSRLFSSSTIAFTGSETLWAPVETSVRTRVKVTGCLCCKAV